MGKAKEVLDKLERGEHVGPLKGSEVSMSEIQTEMSRRGLGGTHSYGGGSDCASPSIDVWGKGHLGILVWGS